LIIGGRIWVCFFGLFIHPITAVQEDWRCPGGQIGQRHHVLQRIRGRLRMRVWPRPLASIAEQVAAKKQWVSSGCIGIWLKLAMGICLWSWGGLLYSTPTWVWNVDPNWLFFVQDPERKAWTMGIEIEARKQWVWASINKNGNTPPLFWSPRLTRPCFGPKMKKVNTFNMVFNQRCWRVFILGGRDL
jgi:hypothetical protein